MPYIYEEIQMNKPKVIKTTIMWVLAGITTFRLVATKTKKPDA